MICRGKMLGTLCVYLYKETNVHLIQVSSHWIPYICNSDSYVACLWNTSHTFKTFKKCYNDYHHAYEYYLFTFNVDICSRTIYALYVREKVREAAQLSPPLHLLGKRAKCMYFVFPLMSIRNNTSPKWLRCPKK